MNPFKWARAEILRSAWRRGRYTPPDRRVLEGAILPDLVRDPAVNRVLFVGVQWYTKGYPAEFGGKMFATIDPDPEVASLGGRPHAVGEIQDVERHFPGIVFDAIIMTGVIGYGLDSRREVDRALAACAAVLRPGGWLILGFNELRPSHIDPGVSAARDQFEPRPFGTLPSARLDIALPFKERWHTFLFWQKKGTP